MKLAGRFVVPEEILQQYIAVKPGDTYSQRLIAQSEQALRRLAHDRPSAQRRSFLIPAAVSTVPRLEADEVGGAAGLNAETPLPTHRVGSMSRYRSGPTHGSGDRGHPDGVGYPEPVKERPMGVGDKMKNVADAAKGKTKEKAGDATDDRDLQAEGQAEKTKADLKQAGEKAKDAFKD